MAIGDTLVIRAGCDKRLETGRAKFANVASFRGFPHIPDQDVISRYVPRDGGHDPTPAQRSALHTLYHATNSVVRLFAPFLPYVCETLNDRFADASEKGKTVHARGNWPRAEDHVQPDLNAEIGDIVLAIVAATRKVKADLDLSLRAPVDALWIMPRADGLRPEGLASRLGPVMEDVKSVTRAMQIRFDNAPEDVPSVLTPDGRISVHFRLAGKDSVAAMKE